MRFLSRALIVAVLLGALGSAFSTIKAAEEPYEARYQKNKALFDKLFFNTANFRVSDVANFIRLGGDPNVTPGFNFSNNPWGNHELGSIGDELPLIFWVLILAKLPIEQKRAIVKYLLEKLKERGQLPITTTLPDRIQRWPSDPPQAPLFRSWVEAIPDIVGGENILHIAALLNDPYIVEELQIQGAVTEEMGEAHNNAGRSPMRIGYESGRGWNSRSRTPDPIAFRNGQYIGSLLSGIEVVTYPFGGS